MTAPYIKKPLYPIKPFSHLDRTHQAEIRKWKDKLSYCDRDLLKCLNHLGVPQLEPYLVWLPRHRLYELVQLAEGGFAKVYKAKIYINSDVLVAAKELKPSMVPEVSLSAVC